MAIPQQQEFIRVIATPSHAVVPPLYTPQNLLGLFEIHIEEALQASKMPLNFCFVGDNSGSMKGAKLNAMKESICHCIDRMNPEAIISVIIFCNEARTIIPAQKVGDVRNKNRLKKIVMTIEYAGGTRIHTGLEHAISEITKFQGTEYLRRIYLLSDGDTKQIENAYSQAKRAKTHNIKIYPFGLGIDWEVYILNNIGLHSGGGKAEYIAKPADAIKIFLRELEVTQSVAVTNAELILRVMEGTTLYEISRALPEISPIASVKEEGRELTFHLGDISQEAPHAVLTGCSIAPRGANLWMLMIAIVRFDVPMYGLVGAKRQEATAQLNINVADIPKLHPINPKVWNIHEKIKAQELADKILTTPKTATTLTQAEQQLLTRQLDDDVLESLQSISQGASLGEHTSRSIKSTIDKLTTRYDL